MRKLKQVGLILGLGTMGLAVSSGIALADAPTGTLLDSCTVNCGGGGSCSASSGWQFWEDCGCKCTSSGTALCGCGSNEPT